MTFPLPAHITTIDDAVRWYTERWFSDLLERLDQEMRPIIEIWNTTFGEPSSLEINRLTETAIQTIRHHLERMDPEFWRSYSHGKGPGARELMEIIWNVSKLISTQRSHIEQRAIRQHQAIEQLRQSVKDDERQAQQLAAKIQTIESPLGPIPLGFHTFVFAFPVLLCAVLLRIAWLFDRSVFLYRTLHIEFQRTYPEYDGNRLQILANAWYLPPYTSLWIPAVLVVNIGLIMGITVWDIVGILWTSESLMENGTLGAWQRPLLAMLYSIGGLSSVWGVSTMARSLNNLRESIPDSSRSRS